MNHKAKDKDFSINQKLKQENEKLKRQLGRLKKQLSRIDFETYSNIKEVIEAQEREDIAFEAEEKDKQEKEDIRKIWECHKCGGDYLRLIVVSRPDGDFYLRRCPMCKNKTKLKPFTDSVGGLETRELRQTRETRVAREIRETREAKYAKH